MGICANFFVAEQHFINIQQLHPGLFPYTTDYTRAGHESYWSIGYTTDFTYDMAVLVRNESSIAR